MLNKSELKPFKTVKSNQKIYELLHHIPCLNSYEIKSLENDFTQIKAVYQVLGYTHHTELLIKDAQLVHHECDCHLHTLETACPHVTHLISTIIEQKPTHDFTQDVAQLHQKQQDDYLQMRKRQERERLLSASHTIIEKFRKDYEDKLQIQINDQPIEIEAMLLDDYDELTLTFKVGNRKKYVIKDIQFFLNCIDQEEEVSYGKELRFKHKFNYFDELAKKQIAFMRTQQHPTSSFYFDHAARKQLYLTSDNLDEFALIYENNGGKNFDVKIGEEKPVIEISKENDLVTFSFPENKRYVYGKKHAYEIIPHKDFRRIYKHPMDEGGKTVELLKELSTQNLVLAEQDTQLFYKYVLSDILPYIELIGLEDETQNVYDTINCYGEMNQEGQMLISLKYTNGKDEIKGFDSTHVTSYQQDLCEAYIQRYASYIDEEKHVAIFNEDEQILEFIQMGFPYLSKICNVFVSDEIKVLATKRSYSISVGVRVKNNLLEIDMDSIQIPKDELKDVLKAYRRRKKFFRLKNGELLSLDSEELEELDQFMQDYHLDEDDLNKGRAIVDSYRMFGLSQAEEKAKKLSITCDDKIKQQINRFDTIFAHESTVLPAYEPILRDYQKEGVAWLQLLHEFGFNGILADDMGLGKTLQVIAFLEGLPERKTSCVVCPSSLIYNWENEVAKFSQTLKVLCITGNQKIREESIKKLQDYDLIITSYDYMRRDVELYQNFNFDYVILDEAQYIKNQKTKNAVSVKRLHCEHRLALTGTPIENSLAELWSIFDFLMPDYLFNYHYFQTHYESEIIRNENEEKQQDLRKLVSPFILRRNKKDVLKELPDKIERVQYVEFNEEENKLYLAHLANVNEELQAQVNIENPDKFQILAMLTRLRQLCCEPRAVYENIETPSSKLLACMELIESLKENHQKCLLFSSFTTMLDFIAQELEKAHISYYLLTGKTSKEERQQLVEKFQQDETTVFLISLKAGGTGLNLTAAEAVIHFDPWWNQSAQNQATDRAYRMGQNKNVQVVELVMKNSIEEKIQTLKVKKKELADAIVENNEASLKAMSKDELMELFAMD